MADRLAKAALSRHEIDINIGLGKTELTNLIEKRQKLKANSQWQGSSSNSVHFMRNIVPSLLDTKISLSKQFERRNRLLVNAPKFLAKGPVACDFCNTNKTVEHVLLYCDKSIGHREELKTLFNKNNVPFNLQTLLAPTPHKNLTNSIINFISDIVEEI